MVTLWFLFIPSQSNGDSGGPYRVLVIHSFGRDFQPFAAMAREFRAELANFSPRPIEFIEASLEKKRFDSIDKERPLKEYLAALFKQDPPDLIAAIGAPAMYFCQRNRDVIFPFVPLLNVGVDKRRLISDVRDDEAFVYSDVDLARVIDHIKKLLPDTKHLYLVSGTAPIDSFWESEVRSTWPQLAPEINFHWMSDYSVASLKEKLVALPPMSVIFFSILSTDGAGIPHLGENALTMIKPFANAPVFGYSSEQFGLGIVGGPLFDTKEMGRQAAEIAARIFSGESAGDITAPVVGLDLLTYDWRELDRWGIAKSNLPSGSVIKFEPQSIWQTHRRTLVFSVLALLLQSLCIALLIVARKKASESNASLQLATKAANIGLWNFSENRKPEIICSPLWRKLFGVEENFIMQHQHLMQRIHPDDRLAFTEAIHDAALKESRFEIEHRVVLDDDRIRWISSRGLAKPGKSHGISMDISQRKQAEFELDRQRNHLAHLSRVNTLGGLSSAIAHEINQPLAAILSNAQAARRLLLKSRGNQKEISQILDSIITADCRAADIIKRLRALFQRSDVVFEKLAIDDCIDEVLSLVSEDLKAHSISVKRIKSSPMSFVMADRIQLQQVFLNLITNARDAMIPLPAHQRLLILETASEAEDVLIKVVDSGFGWEFVDKKWFEPFRSTKTNGLGMGLFICKTILDAHSGKLKFESQPGKGTVCTVSMPNNSLSS